MIYSFLIVFVINDELIPTEFIITFLVSIVIVRWFSLGILEGNAIFIRDVLAFDSFYY